MKFGSGDNGWTRLFSGERVPKYDTRLELIGTLDEATSSVGLAKTHLSEQEAGHLIRMQETFYLMMAEVASDPESRSKYGFRVVLDHLRDLETTLETYLERIELPNKFIVPGACVESALLDLARTVVRRAERLGVRARDEGLVDNPHLIVYLNRASTLLYVLARFEEAKRGLGYVTLRLQQGRATTSSEKPKPVLED